jgi:hypothetical protein
MVRLWYDVILTAALCGLVRLLEFVVAHPVIF